MKKNALILMVGLLVCMLAGCGEAKEPETADEALEQIESEIEEMIAEEEAEEEAGETANETTIEGEIIEHPTFDAVTQWNEVSSTSGAVQIDDILYIPGVSMNEIMMLVDSSSLDYTYEYNPEKLVLPEEEEILTIYCNDIPWFYIEVYNCFDENVAINNLPVKIIEPSIEAYPYCYFIDGRAYSEIIGLYYNDVLLLGETVFSELSFEQFDDSGNGTYCIKYGGWVNYQTNWTGCEIYCLINYQFYIDSNTDYVTLFRLVNY
ncbi:MAG: hypothetical protein E7285_06730 [Lachnospiraceae bacterium]|nr:hypothetical protein [Lachnospiraceae bacterium]